MGKLPIRWNFIPWKIQLILNINKNVLDNEKVAEWIKNGAKPTDTVKKLIEVAAK